MENKVDYVFDEKKFDALLNELENNRQEGAATINANNKSNRRDSVSSSIGILGIFMGMGFLFILGIGVIFFLSIISVSFRNFMLMIIPFVSMPLFITVIVLVPLLIYRKKLNRITQKNNQNYNLEKNYYYSVKEKLIGEIIQSFNSSFEYYPKGLISAREFNNMRLYNESHGDSFGTKPYHGSDYICGKVGSTNIELCEFSIGDVSGLFMVADFNKDFSEITKVLTRVWKKRSLDVIGIINGENIVDTTGNYKTYKKTRDEYLNRKLEEVILESPSFNEKFETFSSSQIEARYILSTTMMERILEFRQKFNYEMNFVFVDSKMYFTVNWGSHMFEPYDINKNLIEHKMQLIENTHKQLSYCIQIIEALNLNTELWYSRQGY